MDCVNMIWSEAIHRLGYEDVESNLKMVEKVRFLT